MVRSKTNLVVLDRCRDILNPGQQTVLVYVAVKHTRSQEGERRDT